MAASSARSLPFAEPPGVLVLERALGAIGRGPAGAPSQDLDMPVVLGGRERSVDQFDEPVTAAGSRRTKSTSTESPMCILEAVAA